MTKTYPLNTPDQLWELLDELNPKQQNLNDAVLDAVAARVLELEDQLHHDLDEQQREEIEELLIHGLPNGGEHSDDRSIEQ